MTLETWNSFFQTSSIIVAGLTFILGVGAYFTGSRLSQRHEERMLAAEAKVAEANEKAEEARRDAAMSAERVADLNKQAEALRLEAESARQEIAAGQAAAAKANERASALELETAQQREKTALAERALLELRLRIEPRRLTDGQLKSLIDALRESADKGPVVVAFAIGDAEAEGLAMQLVQALKTGGWPISAIAPRQYAGVQNPVGLSLFIRSAASAPPHALALQRAFRAAEIPLPAIEGMATSEVDIMVGSKPQ